VNLREELIKINMIRKILLMGFALFLIATSAYAQKEVNYAINYSNGEVMIYGETDAEMPAKYVSVTVLNPDVSTSDIPQNFENGGYIAYQNIIDLNTETKKFSLPINLDLLEKEENPYKLIVNMDGNLKTKEIYAYTKETVAEVTDEINSSDSLSVVEKTELFEKAVKYYAGNSLTAYIRYYDKLADEKSAMAEVFFYEKGDGFDVVEGDNPYAEIREALEKAILWAAYNKKLTGGQLVQGELIGFTDDNFSMEIYNNDVSEEGKIYIINSISGEDIEKMKKSFAENTIYARFAYPKDMGYRQIMNLINDDTIRKNLVDYGFKYDLYNSSDKDKVCAELYKNMPSDLKGIAQRLNDLSVVYRGINNSIVAGGGGGGSSQKNHSSIPSSLGTSGVVPNGPVETAEKKEIFSDLDNVAWAKDSIMALYAKGVVSGMGDGKFEPMQNVTREQFVKMLVSAMELLTELSSCDFEDVDKNQWYYPYVACAAEKQIVFGINETTFGIGTNVTREQMAAMCARVIKRTSDKTVETFIDDAEISDYARESVMLMKKLGVINGNEEGKFNPKAYATRAEAAQIIYGILCL